MFVFFFYKRETVKKNSPDFIRNKILIWDFGLMTIGHGGWMICCETFSLTTVWSAYDVCMTDVPSMVCI